jgi:bifunctional enzyme CysN/CysC
MRQGLNRDLGYVAEDRSENLRRAVEVAKILNDSGLIVICAFVAPHDSIRRRARQVIGDDRFAEVYLSCPAEVCARRDEGVTPEQAAAGAIAVADQYEAPSSADLVIETNQHPVSESLETLVAFLADRFKK